MDAFLHPGVFFSISSRLQRKLSFNDSITPVFSRLQSSGRRLKLAYMRVN